MTAKIKRVKRTRTKALKYLNQLNKNNPYTEMNNLAPVIHYKLHRVKSENSTGRIIYLDPFEIVTEQESIYIPVLKKKIQGKFKDHCPNLPVVLKEGKQYIIIDGNHRLCASILLGNIRIRVELYDSSIKVP